MIIKDYHGTRSARCSTCSFHSKVFKNQTQWAEDFGVKPVAGMKSFNKAPYEQKAIIQDLWNDTE